MPVYTRVSRWICNPYLSLLKEQWATDEKTTGIGPKVTQSVLTAAFLFAFKDVLYEQTVRLRMGRNKA